MSTKTFDRYNTDRPPESLWCCNSRHYHRNIAYLRYSKNTTRYTYTKSSAWKIETFAGTIEYIFLWTMYYMQCTTRIHTWNSSFTTSCKMVKYQTALLTSFTSEEITWLCMYTRSNFCVFIFTNPVNSRNLLYSIFMVFKNTKL